MMKQKSINIRKEMCRRSMRYYSEVRERANEKKKDGEGMVDELLRWRDSAYLLRFKHPWSCKCFSKFR